MGHHRDNRHLFTWGVLAAHYFRFFACLHQFCESKSSLSRLLGHNLCGFGRVITLSNVSEVVQNAIFHLFHVFQRYSCMQLKSCRMTVFDQKNRSFTTPTPHFDDRWSVYRIARPHNRWVSSHLRPMKVKPLPAAVQSSYFLRCFSLPNFSKSPADFTCIFFDFWPSEFND